MEVEKRRSRGSFLNFFDWNGKSRKKLFRNDSELSGELKKGAQDAENILKSQLSGFPIELDELASSSNMGCSDYNCAASVNSDGGREPRAPGVVARLMGLDSLPSSSNSELSSSASFDSPPSRSDHLYDRNAYDLLSDYRSVDHINIRSMLEKSSWNTLESRRQKVQKRPIERFQTESLPSRSAKSIPLSHLKLLSPIKTPAFICTNNAAYVIEAAAKIMEASPRAYNVNKTPSIGSSTVPLRIRGLKEKVEAAHHASVVRRQPKPNTSNDVKGKPTDKSYSKSTLVPASRGTRDSGSSNHSRTRGKVTSLALQAKKDVQSREMPISCSNRTIVKNKEQNGKFNQFSRSQQVLQHTSQQRTPACKSNNVLRHNSQKQNVGNAKGKATPKLPTSSQQTRRTRSLDGSTGANEASSKAVSKSKSGPKRFSSPVTDDQKPLLLSKTKSTFQRKRSASGDVLIKETVVDDVQNDFDQRSIKCNTTTDGSKNHHSDEMKQSMDVVSFTFTSPLRSRLTAQVMEMKNNFDLNSFRDNERSNPQALSLSSSELHMIDGSALSALLDKKLQELTFMIQSSKCNLIKEGASAISTSAMSDSLPILRSTASIEEGKSQLDLDGDMDGLCDTSCSASDNLVLNLNQNWQGTESTEESHSSYKIREIGNEVDSMYSRQGSIVLSNFQQRKDIMALKVDAELSESSLSTLTGSMSINCPSRMCSLTDFNRSNDWELDYIKDMLDKLDLMGVEFMLDPANKVMLASLFDVLENHGYCTESYGEEHYKLGRKILFDVVNECLDLRCRQAFLGSCNAWMRWVTLVQRKDILAEDLYREMVGWTSMGELMVDELVGKDMSTRYGKWLDFGVEESEEGVEIEWTLWNSLVDELVSDYCSFNLTPS